MTRLLFVFLCTVLLSCSNEKKGILPEEKMEAVMWDLLRADEWVNYEFSIDSNFRREEKLDSLYSHVFSIHHVGVAEFRKSLDYYQKHPEALKPILDSLQKKPVMDVPGTKPAN